MKQWFALSAIGRDRPGIVADLAELIYECDCNLEDSSMTILGGEFAVLLLLSSQAHNIESALSGACKRLEWEKRLTVFFRPLQGEPRPYGTGQPLQAYELRATGVDQASTPVAGNAAHYAGIVAKITRCLAEHGINITTLHTHGHPEPGSGTAIYTMQVQLDIPAAVGIPTLHQRLEAIADSLHIHIDLIPMAGQEYGLETDIRRQL